MSSVGFRASAASADKTTATITVSLSNTSPRSLAVRRAKVPQASVSAGGLGSWLRLPTLVTAVCKTAGRA